MGEQQPERTSQGVRRKSNCSLWLFLGLLIIGAVGYFTLRGHWSFYGFSHAGAIGVLGLFGVAAGTIARAKGRGYNLAFLLGFVLPIVLGVAAVFAVRIAGGEGTPFYCGGSVSLAVAILIIIGYSVLRKRHVAG